MALWGVLLLLCRRDKGMKIIGRVVGVDAFVSSSFDSHNSIRPGISRATTDINENSNIISYSCSLKPATPPTAASRGLIHLEAAPPRRFSDNAQGPLYVNDSCINCSACSMFAPSVFSRDTNGNTHHIVSKQPLSNIEIEESRAALVACPVAAIRVEKNPATTTTIDKEKTPPASQFAIKPDLNGRPLPFPRPVSPNLPGVYFVGHHNKQSFGATPYLLSVPPPSSSEAEPTWILIDTPLYSKRAVEAVESLTGPDGPSHLVLTHVDDTADHNRWKDRYPDMKRIFHAGDLGEHNWIGDDSLEDVEILLESRSSDNRLQHFDINGTPIDSDGSEPLVLVHTPGHSPGSITLLKKPTASATTTSSNSSPGVLFTGDTYTYSTRDGGHASGMPQYNKDGHELQSKILPLLLDLDWQVLAPGHGHVRDYTLLQKRGSKGEVDIDFRNVEMEAAIEELSLYF